MSIKKPFELTNLEHAVDEDVLKGILKDNGMFLTFYGTRIMALVNSSYVAEPQYEFIEKHYGWSRNDLSTDTFVNFVYSPHDKHLYITMRYSVQLSHYTSNKSKYATRRQFNISLKVGKSPQAEVIPEADADRVVNDPDSCHVLRAANAITDL